MGIQELRFWQLSVHTTYPEDISDSTVQVEFQSPHTTLAGRSVWRHTCSVHPLADSSSENIRPARWPPQAGTAPRPCDGTRTPGTWSSTTPLVVTSRWHDASSWAPLDSPPLRTSRDRDGIDKSCTDKAGICDPEGKFCLRTGKVETFFDRLLRRVLWWFLNIYSWIIGRRKQWALSHK